MSHCIDSRLVADAVTVAAGDISKTRDTALFEKIKLALATPGPESTAASTALLVTPAMHPERYFFQITLTLLEEDEVILYGQQINIWGLRPHLDFEKANAIDQGFQLAEILVVLRVDPQIDMSDVEGVVQHCINEGFTKIEIRAEPPFGQQTAPVRRMPFPFNTWY